MEPFVGLFAADPWVMYHDDNENPVWYRAGRYRQVKGKNNVRIQIRNTIEMLPQSSKTADIQDSCHLPQLQVLLVELL